MSEPAIAPAPATASVSYPTRLPEDLVRRKDDLAGRVEALQISTEADAGRATDFGKQIKVAKAKAEEKRKEWVGPLNQVVASINAQFKTITEPLAAAEKVIKDKLLAYHRQQAAEAEQARKEAEERAAAQAKEAGREPEIAPPVPAAPSGPVRGNMGATASFRKDWTFEVTDLTQVPFAYLQLNERAVKEAIKEGARDIPGVKIFQKESVAIG